jgi:two-component system chemotaxis response regulator CheB
VARAADGDEALRAVYEHKPDVITLDLEMPKMDGFTFLRILMSKHPTPVLVVSGHSSKDRVFKALELGALDVIAKPTQRISPELREIERDLRAKVRLIGRLRGVPLAERLPRGVREEPPGPARGPAIDMAPAPRGALRVVVIGASTGGPPALAQVVQVLPPPHLLPVAIVIAQHMPAKFTGAFAERLGRTSAWTFREARDGDELSAGMALVAPGGAATVLVRQGAALLVKLEAPAPGDHFVPSIDRLFETAAAAVGSSLLGVVLTGMGGDCARGVRAIKAAGGRVVAESAETAVIFGMPEEAIRTGAVEEVLALPQIGPVIARFGGA